MQDLIEVLTPILLLIGGGFFLFERTKRKSAEAQLENTATKEKVLEVDKNSLGDQAKLAIEQEKTAALKKELETPVVTNENLTDMLEFFDKFTKK